MSAAPSARSFVHAGGHRLEVERIAGGRSGGPVLVLLHEGLGSVAMWRDFPMRLAHATGNEVIAYSRHGYGRSDPLTAPRSVRYMHDEALIVLPQLLDALDVPAPILIGHSDGASIALLHAGARVRRVYGVVALAPHVMVEDISIRSIEAARESYATGDLRGRLARHHADVDSAFRGWNDIWLDRAFRSWNIEGCLPAIACPVLAIQGHDDPYGTLEQVDRLARAVADVEVLALENCGHSPHRDHEEVVTAAITRFCNRIAG
ncbi:MAG: alpha/beta hydrolase [Casimicrobiaceae bacterium]